MDRPRTASAREEQGDGRAETARRALLASPWVAVAIVAIAFGVRLLGITGESVWMDECLAIDHASHESLVDVLEVYDSHPTGYFAVLWLWRHAVGTSELAMRSLSVLIACATIPLVWLAGREAFDSRTAFLGATLMAIMPYHAGWSQQIRPYALLTLASACSCYGLFLSLRASMPRHILLYVLGTLAALYTHYYAILLLAGQIVGVGLWLLSLNRRTRRRPALRWTATYAAIALPLCLWYPNFRSEANARFVAGSSESVYTDLVPDATELVKPIAGVFFADTPLPMAVVAIGVLAVLLAFVNGLRSSPLRERVWLLCCTVVPVTAAWLFAQVFAHWVIKGLLITAPLTCVAIARGLVALPTSALRWGLLGLIFVTSLPSFWTVATTSQTDAFREAAAIIEAHQTGNDVVLGVGPCGPPLSPRVLLRRYYRGNAPVLNVDRSIRAPEELAETVEAAASGRHQLWLLRNHGFHGLDKSHVEQIDGFELLGEWELKNIELYLFRAPSAPDSACLQARAAAPSPRDAAVMSAVGRDSAGHVTDGCVGYSSRGCRGVGVCPYRPRQGLDGIREHRSHSCFLPAGAWRCR